MYYYGYYAMFKKEHSSSVVSPEVDSIVLLQDVGVQRLRGSKTQKTTAI
jgi:hypothetical protein